MTAAEFADLLRARRVGPGRWVARCPAHEDRSPSLSIREGADSRILLHCFAGCTVGQILATLKLASRDLYAGPPPSPEQAAALRAAREARELAHRMVRKARRDAWEGVRKWEAIVDALGAKLARVPENETLGRVFHQACGRFHELALETEQAEARVKSEQAR